MGKKRNRHRFSMCREDSLKLAQAQLKAAMAQREADDAFLAGLQAVVERILRVLRPEAAGPEPEQRVH
jgi:hypothetical protein